MKKALLIFTLAIVAFGAWWIYRWESAPEDVARVTVGEEVDTANASENPRKGNADPVSEDEVQASFSVLKEDGEISVSGEFPMDIDTEKTFFKFTGYGVGKSHEGTFETMSAQGFILEDNLSKGVITIEAASVKSDVDALTNHLKQPDFFDVEQFPLITFEGTLDADAKTVTGVLDFHGVQKEITLPVLLTDTSLEIQTVLDVTEFNLEYPGFDREILLEAGLFWN